MPPHESSPEGEASLERGLLTGIAAYRWAAWVWLAVVLVLGRDDLSRPGLAVALAGAALAFTGWATIMLRLQPARLVSVPVVAVEVVIASALLFGDPFAYDGAHSQTLASAWPLASILTAGTAFAAHGGLLAGLVIGIAGLIGKMVGADVAWEGEQVLDSGSTIVLYALAGGASGFGATKLREAERRISAARAREEVARTLHDGVLQTLAVVQRRTEDPDLARLARDQELELREFLFSGPRAAGELGAALRSVAAKYERNYGGRVEVVIADDMPRLADGPRQALVGAVSESLANAGKHGNASSVTVYVEPTDGGGVFCSVKDDGTGFAPDEVAEGSGIRGSIRGRLAEVDGRVEIDGAPGRGTEIRMWVR